jgi:hypothetical protein
MENMNEVYAAARALRSVFTLTRSFFAVGLNPRPSDCSLRARATSTTIGLRPKRCSPARVRSLMLMRSCSANVAMIVMTTSRMMPQESKNGSMNERPMGQARLHPQAGFYTQFWWSNPVDVKLLNGNQTSMMMANMFDE